MRMTHSETLLDWDKAKRGPSKQTAYYDISIITVPVKKEPIDVNEIRQAVHNDWWVPGLSGFSAGGYSTVGSVKDNGDGTVDIEQVYHIGD